MERAFVNLTEFARFIERSVAFEKFADLAARSMAARAIEREVKDRLGQPDKLPPPLAEATMAERERQGFSPDETLLRTGALRESIGWEHVSSRKTIVGSTSDYAVYHEFGGNLPGRPPQRSFLASTMSEHDEVFAGVYFVAFDAAFVPR